MREKYLEESEKTIFSFMDFDLYLENKSKFYEKNKCYEEFKRYEDNIG